jgi:hypothetical protein
MSAQRVAYSSKAMFAYEVDNYNLTNFAGDANTATMNFTTNGDSDFFWNKFAVYSLPPNPDQGPESTTRSGEWLAGVRVLILNQTTGRYMSNNPVPINNIDGYLQFLEEPIIWPKRSAIQISMINDSVLPGGSGAFTIIHMTFAGIKGFF